MIKNINIIKFRGIENKKIELGETITVLAGKNGTQKSTILGLLGQPFVFYGSKHFGTKVELKNEAKQELLENNILNRNDILTILGNAFETKFSDLFKFSPKYELEEEHKYILEFEKDYFEKDKCFMATKSRPGESLRFNHYINEKFGTYGVYRDFIYPTIYLGLSRLYPIGESKKLNKEDGNYLFNDSNLKQEFQDNYNKILKQVENFQEEIVEKDIGRTIGIDTGYYDSFGNSSGQDNVGKILVSLLSFKKLKNKYKGYKGGLLLIDELDVSLFAASQFAIYDIIEKYAKEINLKVIFTTHSLELIKYIKNKNKKENKLYYFTKVGKKIDITENPKFEDIYNNICQRITKEEKKNKVKIFLEDSKAAEFLKEILKLKIKISYLEISGLEMSWKVIKKMNEKVGLKDNIFIYDGDVPAKEVKKNNESKLPLNKALEQEMLNYLNNKEPEDEIWDKFAFTENYFKNRIINEYKVNLNDTTSCKNALKDENFYKEVKSRFIKYWLPEHKNEIEKFIEKFIEIYVKVKKIDNYSIDEILK